MNVVNRRLLRGGVVAAVAAALMMPSVAFAQDGSGGGLSTPGVIVTAQNPGTSKGHSDLRITLTAHTEQSIVSDPSCRPQDATLRCWGSLFLQVPEMGGMTITRFEVHRVAVGDITCGHDENGGCGDEGGGCGDEGGCEGGAMAAVLASSAAGEPVLAQVNGLAVVTNPGTGTISAGTQVQVMITLTDNGKAQYHDLMEVQVNKFVPGPDKPLIYQSGPQTIQQVQIHFVGTTG